MQPPDLRGVTVATILPFDNDLEIDWESYARVLDYCATPEGIAAVFVNGHAGEGGLLSEKERDEVIRRTRSHIGSKPLLAGVIANSTAQAIAEARLAQKAGADCAVLFPPSALGQGAAMNARAPVAYVRSVAEAIDIPVSIFQYPVPSGLGFTTDTLAEMAAIPGVIAIKEGSDVVQLYEDNWRAVKKANPELAFLPSNYNWFLPQLAIGADGILSGLVSLVPHLFVRLWDATAAADLQQLRALNDELHPIVRTIYGSAPLIDMHTRIKVGLQAMGIIRSALPRPPLMAIEPGIQEKIRQAVNAAREAGTIVR